MTDPTTPTTRTAPPISPVLTEYTRQLEEEVRSLRRRRAAWERMFWSLVPVCVAALGIALWAVARMPT